MPRFFFHLHDDLDVPDIEGVECADLTAAHARAICSARSLMCETVQREGRITLHHRIDVEDDRKVVLASVAFRDAVRIEDQD